MASRNAELETTSLRVQKIIDKIQDGEIKIPEFQRGFVWKQVQVIELLESVMKNYPIGSLLLWEADKEDKLDSSRNIAGIDLPDVPDNYPVQYCLDGQQRISTMFGVFWECAKPATDSRYNPEQDVFEVYFDLETDSFIHSNEIDVIDKTRYFYLRDLLDTGRIVDAFLTQGLSKESHDKIKKLSSQFLNYDVPVIKISKRDISEVGVIFERINNTGVKLNTMDLMTAWTWDENFHLRDEIDELVDKLEIHSGYKLDNTLMLQISSAIINDSTSSKNILSTKPDVFKTHWEGITKAIGRAIDHLSDVLLCKSGKFLPFKQLVCGMSYFFYKCPKPTSVQLESLNAWFWISSFNQRYNGGNTTQKMDHDLSVILKIIDGEKMTKIEPLKLSKEVLQKATFTIRSPLTRAFLLLQAQSSPLDLCSGAPINIGSVLSSYNRREFHHVFPDSFLKNEQKISVKDERYKLLNFCFLTSISNKQISAKSPKEYFSNLVPQHKLSEIIDSNLLPPLMSVYQGNQYLVFIKRRAELTLDKIKSITDKK